MSIFDRIIQGNTQNQLHQLKSNPQEMIRQKGWSIPDNLMGNPQAMVMHLIQTGQVGGPAVQQAMQMMRGMGK